MASVHLEARGQERVNPIQSEASITLYAGLRIFVLDDFDVKVEFLKISS